MKPTQTRPKVDPEDSQPISFGENFALEIKQVPEVVVHSQEPTHNQPGREEHRAQRDGQPATHPRKRQSNEMDFEQERGWLARCFFLHLWDTARFMRSVLRKQPEKGVCAEHFPVLKPKKAIEYRSQQLNEKLAKCKNSAKLTNKILLRMIFSCYRPDLVFSFFLILGEYAGRVISSLLISKVVERFQASERLEALYYCLGLVVTMVLAPLCSHNGWYNGQ